MTALQHDLFSGELVDNRTRRQKQQDKAQRQPRLFDLTIPQIMADFKPFEVPLGATFTLLLQDPRSEAEKEAHCQQEAEAMTYRLEE